MQHPFSKDESYAYWLVTAYSLVVIYYFVYAGEYSLIWQASIAFSVVPATVIYGIVKEFANEIIELLLEQHVAIARAKLELEHGGEFDDWYQGENESSIDALDVHSSQKIAVFLCGAFIGFTAPPIGFYFFQAVGAIAGFLVLLVCALFMLHAISEVKRAIERSPKVIKT